MEIYCRENKEGLFFKVEGGGRNLWPFIKHFCHPDTNVVCSDEVKQYVDIEKIFGPNTVHKTTNHSKGEFVGRGNKSNTINDLESES